MIIIWIPIAFSLLLILRSLFAGYLFTASQLVTGSPAAGRIIYTLLLFPGVLLHELAHFFSASMLGVATGAIEVFPREGIDGYRLGSVRVAKTDVVRRAAIGASPLFVGTAILSVILHTQFSQVFTSTPQEVFQSISMIGVEGKDALFLYLIFTISNTMVLSKSDRTGIIPVAILFGTGAGLIFTLASFSIPVEGVLKWLASLTRSLAVSFTAVAVVDFIFLVPLIIFVTAIAKIRRKRVRLSLFRSRIGLEI